MSVLPVPEGVDETYWLLNQGLALFHDGDYFVAHEIWEQAWSGEVGQVKRTLQVLIQIAAALHKDREGNRRGTAKLLGRAVELLAEVLEARSAVLSLDLVALERGLRQASERADARAAGDEVPLPIPALPKVVPLERVLYLHGFASGPGSQKARHLVPPLVAAGYDVAVPDLDEDDFQGLTLSRALARARRCLAKRTVIVGSSMGGYLGALLAAQDERVAGLLLLAPAFELGPRLFARHGQAALDAWRAQGTMLVEHHQKGGRWPLAYSFYEDAQRHPGRPGWRAPTVVLQGRRDEVVDPALVESVVAKMPNVTLHLLDDDHGLVASSEGALEALWGLLTKVGLRKAEAPPDPAAVRAALVEAD